MVSVLIFRYGSFFNFHHKALTSSNLMSVFMGCQASMRDPPPLTIKPILLSRLSSIALASLKIPRQIVEVAGLLMVASSPAMELYPGSNFLLGAYPFLLLIY